MRSTLTWADCDEHAKIYASSQVSGLLFFILALGVTLLLVNVSLWFLVKKKPHLENAVNIAKAKLITLLMYIMFAIFIGTKLFVV